MILVLQKVVAQTKFIKSGSSAFKRSSFSNVCSVYVRIKLILLKTKVEDIDIGGYRNGKWEKMVKEFWRCSD